MSELTEKSNKIDQIFEEEVIDLREYMRVLGKHKWSIFGITLFAGILSALIVFTIKPIYSSTATLLIEPGNSNVVSIEDVYGIDANDEYFKTQFEVIKSRFLSERVIDKLDLANHLEFLPDDEGSFLSVDWRGWIRSFLPAKKNDSVDVAEDEAAREGLIADFSSRLKVTPVRGSQLVKLSFEAHDRKLAATVVNTLAETYIVSDMEAKLQMTSMASVWLTERMDVLRVKLRDSEKALQDYREKEQLIEVDGVATLTAQQLQELGLQLVTAQQSRSLTQATLKQIQSLKGQSADKLSTIPAVLKDPLYASLRQAEAEAQQSVSTLSKQYGIKHPKLIQAKAHLAESTASLKNHVSSIMTSVEKEYQVALNNESAIRSSMSRAKKSMQSINRKSYQLRVLERDVESNRQLYDLFLSRIKETDETGGLEKVSARISDPATASIHPIKPKKSLIVVISSLLGLFLAVVLAFLLEHLDNTIKNSNDIEDKLKISMLGILPHLRLKKKDNNNSFTYSARENQSFFAESVRTIRTSILLSGLDNPFKIILVTSSVPGEGKSTVSINLALMMSDLKKVLLIDADLRRPSVAKALNLDNKSEGLSEFVSGTAELSQCIEKIDDSNAYVMHSGLQPANPLEMLSSKRFAESLKDLSQDFDHIIIDSAPALAVSDSLVLSSYADGVVYVVKADSTPLSAVQEGIKRLRRVDANLIGGVLNDLPESKKRSSYGKYGAYNDSYHGSYGYTN